MKGKQLEGIRLFNGLSEAERDEVARRSERVEYAPETTIVEEGRFSFRFFVVIEGVVAVVRDAATINKVGPGGFFGELGVLPHGTLKWGRRTATVVAATRVRAIAIPGVDLRELIRLIPPLGEAIESVAAERIALVD